MTKAIEQAAREETLSGEMSLEQAAAVVGIDVAELQKWILLCKVRWERKAARRVLTVRQAAQLLGVDPFTVQRWIWRGKIRATRQQRLTKLNDGRQTARCYGMRWIIRASEISRLKNVEKKGEKT